MARLFSARLSETWLKAAVVGSLWASFEIIIGSFLHNMRFPFAGSILAFASVGLIVAFSRYWSNPGLIWRAGLIAALLKSLSPSAIILGPMIGIFSEALIIQIFIWMFGRNLLAWSMGGGLAVLSALMHKVVSLLVTYGFDLVVIVEELYQFIIRQMGLSKGNPELLVIGLMLAYTLAGVLGAILGYLAGGKALKYSSGEDSHFSLDKQRMIFRDNGGQRSSPWWLLVHLLCIVGCLYVLNTYPLQIAFIPAVAYTALCLYFYRNGMRSFRKPSFWIWFMAITILAAVFWNGLSKGTIWDWEGLLVGIRMNLRAMVILTGFAALSRELHNPIIRAVLYHRGFASVYHSVELAFSVLPGVIESLPKPRKLIIRPVSTLGLIVSEATSLYPALRRELEGYSPVVILSGEIQGGKTGYLRRLLEELKKKDLKMKGFMAVGVHDEKGERYGYDLHSVESGESSLYIRKTPAQGWFRHGRFSFSKEGQAFGEKILQDISSENTELAVIDELGPVELKGKGWASEVERLLSQCRCVHLWVVRKTLLKRMIRQWNIGDVLLVDVAEDQVADAAEAIFSFVRDNSKQRID